jgi:hypothetical protein
MTLTDECIAAPVPHSLQALLPLCCRRNPT